MKKLFFLYTFFLTLTTSLCSYDLDWEIHKQETLFEQPKIPGYCSKEQADLLMSFIYETKPVTCIEIGVLSGSSSFPIAKALSFLKHGTLYSIDAWDNQAFIEGLEADDPTVRWWNSLNINMDGLYQEFNFMIQKNNLNAYCHPTRGRSEKVVTLFPDNSIDFLYLDGNISAKGSLKDAVLYLPKVKEGGYIWLNMAELDAKAETVAFLMKNCRWIKEKSFGIHCILLKKETKK